MIDRRRSLLTTIEQILFRWARPALVVYWPVLAISTHGQKIGEAIPNPSLIWFNLDKLIHAGAFAFLGFLLIYARVTGRTAKLGVSIFAGTVVAAVYAAIDESTQGMFGRTVSMKDLYADWVGIGAVGLGVWLISGQRKNVNNPDSAQTTGEQSLSSQDDDHATAFVGHTVRVSVLTFFVTAAWPGA